QIDGNTGQIIASVGSESQQLLMHGTDCGVWLFRARDLRLLRYDENGAQQVSVKLQDLDATLDGIDLLAANSVDGSFWATRGTRLFHLGNKGRLITVQSLAAIPQQIKVGLDQTLWVIQQGRLLQISNDGQILSDTALPANLGSPSGLSIDSLRDKLWIT